MNCGFLLSKTLQPATFPILHIFSLFPQGLNDNEEMALIDIMVCACKQASTRQGPPGRTARKAKENKSSVNDNKELSAHFMQTLPGLLNKV